jgi:hypothetical protein
MTSKFSRISSMCPFPRSSGQKNSFSPNLIEICQWCLMVNVIASFLFTLVYSQGFAVVWKSSVVCKKALRYEVSYDKS